MLQSKSCGHESVKWRNNEIFILKKIIKKKPSDLDKRKKNTKNHTSWQENQCPEKKK